MTMTCVGGLEELDWDSPIIILVCNTRYSTSSL